MLFHLGFGEVWYNQGVGDAGSFIYLFKQRINDIFSQNWRSSLEDSTRARTYKLLRTDFVTREYLETVNCASHLTAFARLVTSSHRLRVENGRWDKPVATEYKDRKCQLCNSGDIEDEYHFVLKCPVYSSIRRRCVPRQYWYRPNMMKFQNLFSKKYAHIIIALAIYTILPSDVEMSSLCNKEIYSSSAMPSSWYNKSMGHVAQGPGPPSSCPLIHDGHGDPLVVGVLWISPMDIWLLGGLQWPGGMGWVPGWWFRGGSLCGVP